MCVMTVNTTLVMELEVELIWIKELTKSKVLAFWPLEAVCISKLLNATIKYELLINWCVPAVSQVFEPDWQLYWGSSPCGYSVVKWEHPHVSNGFKYVGDHAVKICIWVCVCVCITSLLRGLTREETILWECAHAGRMKKSPSWEVHSPNKTPTAEALSNTSELGIKVH